MLATLALAAVTSAGCLGSPSFVCHADAQCGPNNFCESDGHCSARDTTCLTRRRYLSAAGDRASACVQATCAQNRIVAISAGSAHACVLRQHGQVTCWGLNANGQLGDGTRTPRSTGADVPDLNDATAIAAGERHTCALRAGGVVACWGADDTGQLGDGGGGNQLRPVPVPGVSGALEIAAGAGFSCALLGDLTAVCWGDDRNGEIGDGATSTVPRPPTPVMGLTSVLALSAHWQHACAILGDASLVCWGSNASGQIGDGTLTNRPSPAAVTGLRNVAAVATGLSHTCAMSAAAVWCWGSNSQGQLGATSSTSTTPDHVPGPGAAAHEPDRAGSRRAAHVRRPQHGPGAVLGAEQQRPARRRLDEQPGRAGSGHRPRHRIHDRGRHDVLVRGHRRRCRDVLGRRSQRPAGHRPRRRAAAASPAGRGGDRVTTGGAHSCGVVPASTTGAGARFTCWGSDQAGQLGDNDDSDRARPVPLEVPLQAGTIAAGAQHTCAVDATGGLWCWGRGSSGQIGPGRAVDTPFPIAVPVPDGAARAVSVSAGDSHSCAVFADGLGTPLAACFGANDHGQLGDGTPPATRRRLPSRWARSPAGGTLTLSAGGAHTCAVDGAGHLWCWGRGDRGQLGDGAMSDAPRPRR